MTGDRDMKPGNGFRLAASLLDGASRAGSLDEVLGSFRGALRALRSGQGLEHDFAADGARVVAALVPALGRLLRDLGADRPRAPGALLAADLGGNLLALAAKLEAVAQPPEAGPDERRAAHAERLRLAAERRRDEEDELLPPYDPFDAAAGADPYAQITDPIDLDEDLDAQGEDRREREPPRGRGPSTADLYALRADVCTRPGGRR